MDDLDTEKLQETLAILKEAGVRRFKFNGLLIEFTEDEAEPRTTGFAKPAEESESNHPGYSRLFGGRMPSFTAPGAGTGVNDGK